MISDPESIDVVSAGPLHVVMEAEMAVLVAQDQLRTLQERALIHGGYDPDAYDAAIIAYRESRAWAGTVRAAWRCWQAEHGLAVSGTSR